MRESANTYRRLFRLFSEGIRRGLDDTAPRDVERDEKLAGHHSVLDYAQLGDKHILDNVGRTVRYRALASSDLHRREACEHRSGPGCAQQHHDPDIRHDSNQHSQTSMGRNEAASLALEQVWVALVLV